MGDGPKPPSSWCGSQVSTMGIGLKSAIVSASARQPAFMSHLAPGNMAGMDRHLERGCLTWKFLWKSNLFWAQSCRTWTKRESNWNQLGMKLEWNGRGHDVRNHDQIVTNREHVRYICWWEADRNAWRSDRISRLRSTCHMFPPNQNLVQQWHKNARSMHWQPTP